MKAVSVIFYLTMTGSQPEIFQERFRKIRALFVKNTIKKAQQGKVLEFFLLDNLKITF